MLESSGECLRGSATQEGWIDTNFGRQFGQQSYGGVSSDVDCTMLDDQTCTVNSGYTNGVLLKQQET